MATKKVKICFVVAVDITIKLILLNYLRRLQRENYEVWIVCSPSPYLFELAREGFKVAPIKISRRITPLADVVSLITLTNFFKKERFDLVQLQTPKAAFLGQLGARFAGIPLIINNNFGFYFENFSWLKRKAFVFFERFAARRTNLMFTINKEDIATAIKEKIFPPEKITYLGFGIDTGRFNPEKYSPEFIAEKKQELQIASDKKVVGIVARLVEEKGYLELFEAFKRVVAQVPETLLLIVGILEPEKKDGIDIAIINKYGIENNVLFLGQRENVAELYSIMDVFVLPTRREGLGNTILEASAMQKPIVATNVRGPRESVDDGKTGILVPPKNAEKLAEALVYILKNPDTGKKFGVAGRQKVTTYFNEEAVFNRMKNVYEKLYGYPSSPKK